MKMEEKNLSYEEAMKRLDEIISILENNKATLDESIKLYQEGVSLAAYCDSQLKNVEDRVAKIFNGTSFVDMEDDHDGNNH
jgi:exodeoxyribonuclease VII small subunit